MAKNIIKKRLKFKLVAWLLLQLSNKSSVQILLANEVVQLFFKQIKQQDLLNATSHECFQFYTHTHTHIDTHFFFFFLFKDAQTSLFADRFEWNATLTYFYKVRD